MTAFENTKRPTRVAHKVKPSGDGYYVENLTWVEVRSILQRAFGCHWKPNRIWIVTTWQSFLCKREESAQETFFFSLLVAEIIGSLVHKSWNPITPHANSYGQIHGQQRRCTVRRRPCSGLRKGMTTELWAKQRRTRPPAAVTPSLQSRSAGQNEREHQSSILYNVINRWAYQWTCDAHDGAKIFFRNSRMNMDQTGKKTVQDQQQF